jgi:site-specific DNA recombinase
VQDFLDGKKDKKKKRTTIFSNEKFLLRGHLVCPSCGKVLTASASKGRTKKYCYYHCHYTCGVRFKSPIVNEAFCDHLMKYNAKDGMTQVYYKMLKSVYQRNWAKKTEARGKFTERLDDLHEKIKKARFKFMNDEISKNRVFGL